LIITNTDVQIKKTGDKTSQKVLVAGDKIMMVEFHFAKGGVGALHKHDDHEQIGYVAKGSFGRRFNSDRCFHTVTRGFSHKQ